MKFTWLRAWFARSDPAPRRVGPSTHPVPRPPDLPAGTISPGMVPRLLLVEDDWRTHSALRRIFTRLGWEVDSAATVAGAIEMLDRRPRALILDLMLADGVGLELLRHVRGKFLPVRVVVTTGTTDRGLREEVERLAPDALLAKPVDLDDLLRAVGVALKDPSGDQLGELLR